jgi:hypothetical protein
MQQLQLYHVSEDAGIEVFKPRPSPQVYDGIKGNVVYAIINQLLHNYLLPRNCPRVCFYKGPDTTQKHADAFFAHAAATYIMAVENNWFKRITNTTLYCYEMPAATFTLLDECAGYYISYDEVVPTSVKKIDNIFEELLTRHIELRFVPNLWPLAEVVKQSTLQFSLIRMRNAAK